MQVEIGGNRLGSGNKMTTNLKNFNRSSHNLSENWMSSMAPGVLYPFYCNIGLNGDTFNIDLQAAARTLPTQGPLFGSFKLQLDMFAVPIRLYHGILHNNMVDIGLQMNKVKLPLLYAPTRKVATKAATAEKLPNMEQIEKAATNPSSLLRYLGYNGAGLFDGYDSATTYKTKPLIRPINAVPMLAYYDIFKNYYSNKQEKNAFIIHALEENENYLTEVKITKLLQDGTVIKTDTYTSESELKNIPFHNEIEVESQTEYFFEYTIVGQYENANLKIDLYKTASRVTTKSLQEMIDEGLARYVPTSAPTTIVFDETALPFKPIKIGIKTKETAEKPTPKLQSFPLKNIDNLRKKCLLNVELDQITKFQNGDEDAEFPMKALTNWKYDGTSGQLTIANEFPLNGLVVKTYQSDIFNNFLDTELISGDNGVNAITTIDTTQGLQMDALILQKKVYDMLNRIVVKGNTYQDWQEAVWTQKAHRLAETPLWIGGYSDEIIFEEIIQTSSSQEGAPLGDLAGKGKLLGAGKGGHVKYKCDEPCFIMGIVSITPRLTYSQGNQWYLTDIYTLDDLHKPSLDGIGFQDLIAEQAAWHDAKMYSLIDGEEPIFTQRNAIGKTPAWINYMTAVDKCFGDFAQSEGKSYMVLNRNYGIANKHIQIPVPTPQDYYELTTDYLGTYIDPTKFNYAFTYTELDAQNFWVQIRSNIIARRLMSAKIIPNL